MKKYLCRFAGCSELLDSPGYCPNHNKEPRKPFSNAIRSNENLYHTSEWRVLRKKHLLIEPYCVECGSNLMLSVDHIRDPLGDIELFLNENNLQTLCRYHHSQKTNREIRERKDSNDRIKNKKYA